ncbi:MAG: hypothetical protein WAV09_04090 [Minisyncoccia bacterium]
MIKPKFYGMILDGKMVITDREQFDLYLQKFKHGTEMEMTISRKYKKRTSGGPDEATNFNGYWWAVIVRMVSDQMGEINDDYTHNLIQIEIGNYKETKSGYRIPAGTKDMSGGEFADLCARARVWASKELGISIPEPHEAAWE